MARIDKILRAAFKADLCSLAEIIAIAKAVDVTDRQMRGEELNVKEVCGTWVGETLEKINKVD